MGWLEATLLLAVGLFLGTAVTASGMWAAVVAGGRKPRARVPFVLGLLAGVMVGKALTARSRWLNGVGISTLNAFTAPLRAGSGHPVVVVGFRALTATGSLIRRGRVLLRPTR